MATLDRREVYHVKKVIDVWVLKGRSECDAQTRPGRGLRPGKLQR